MIFRSSPGRMLLVAALLSAALAGCGKRGTDEAAGGAESSGASSTGMGSSGASGTGTGSTGAASGTAESSGAGTGGTGSAGGTASTAGRTIDDSVITTKLKTTMLTDPILKGADISVETRNGEVVLTGSVSTQAQKDHAVKAAQAVGGVKGVNNKLAMKK